MCVFEIENDSLTVFLNSYEIDTIQRLIFFCSFRKKHMLICQICLLYYEKFSFNAFIPTKVYTF